MHAKVTKRQIDAINPNEKDEWIWDTDVTGFCVRCRKKTASGRQGAKTFMVKYGTGNNQHWIKIGRFGSPWTVDLARSEAVKKLGAVASGVDLAEIRDDARAELTVASLCDEYIEEGCGHKKTSTIAIDRGRIERHIKPLLGKKRIGVITRTDVVRFLKDVAEGKTAADVKTGPRGRAIVKGGKGTANKATALLGAIYTYAIEQGYTEANPIHGVKRYKEDRRERFLSSDEMQRLGAVLAAVEEENAELPGAVTATRLLALTGARKGEIINAKWEYVDFERGLLRLPDSKTGRKDILLGAAALEVLQRAPRVDGSAYVCSGTIKNKPLGSLQKAWERIRIRADLPGLRLHDLRHSFASVSATGGDSLLVIGAMLGHRQPSTTKRYSHLADDPVRAAADRTSRRIAALMGGASGEVVPLRKGDLS